MVQYNYKGAIKELNEKQYQLLSLPPLHMKDL